MSDLGMGRHVEREILSALVDGELTPDERRFVHDHLRSCSACRDTVEEFTHIHGMVTGLPALVAPESFVSAVLRPPASSPARRVAAGVWSGRRRWVVGALAGAAAAITVAGLAAPAPANAPPVDLFIERHVSVHAGVESGGQVLFAVDGR